MKRSQLFGECDAPSARLFSHQQRIYRTRQRHSVPREQRRPLKAANNKRVGKKVASAPPKATSARPKGVPPGAYSNPLWPNFAIFNKTLPDKNVVQVSGCLSRAAPAGAPRCALDSGPSQPQPQLKPLRKRRRLTALFSLTLPTRPQIETRDDGANMMLSQDSLFFPIFTPAAQARAVPPQTVSTISTSDTLPVPRPLPSTPTSTFQHDVPSNDLSMSPGCVPFSSPHAPLVPLVVEGVLSIHPSVEYNSK